MFGSVLATVNESLTTPRPATHASWIFQTKPVILLTSVAMAMEPLALASDGGFCRGGSTGCDCGPRRRVTSPLRVNDFLTRPRAPGACRPDPAEDTHPDEQHEHRT